MSIQLKADNEHPIPDRLQTQKAATPEEELTVAENTVKYLKSTGALPDVQTHDIRKAQQLFKDFSQVSHKTLTQPAVVLALSGYVKEYSSALISDASETRNLIHNRLLEISGCGNPRYELKALELLGKMSDVGAFTEKSELTVTHKSADTLKGLITDKIHRLLDLDVTDAEVITDSLDEELKMLEEDDGGADNSDGVTELPEKDRHPA